MTNSAVHTDLTTEGLIASLPAPYDTYVHGEVGEFRSTNSEMQRFIVTLSQAENFWLQDTRHGAVVRITGNFFGAIKAMLVLNVHYQESSDLPAIYDLADTIVDTARAEAGA